jgi:pimeloyl-ACP methyl ester carboxylesterase
VHFLYLHGFASSPGSSKARFFAERLREAGHTLLCPDFNLPAFEDLTVTRMLEQVETLLAGLTAGPVAVIGSSLGAFVALQLAARYSRIDRLVLLAPALDFEGNRRRNIGDEGLARWRDTDRLGVYHFGYGEPRSVRYALYADAAAYDAYGVAIDIPILIFQGTEDTAVEPASVERFAQGRKNVTLEMLNDDHQLLRSLETIWSKAGPFLGVGAT